MRRLWLVGMTLTYGPGRDSEETEEGNFCGLALLRSPEGITGNRESFSRPNSRLLVGARFRRAGGDQAANPSFL